MNACTQCLLLAALPAFVGVCARGEVVAVDGGGPGAAGGPRFAARQVTAVRGVAGRSATLQCRVLNLGDKAVSWVRSRDLQILSHGGAVFTADGRVSAPARPPHALRIERLRANDAGRYECQLNTEPKTSLFVTLTVVDEAEAETEPTTEPLLEEEEAAADGEGSVRLWALQAAVRGARGGAAELGCAARLLTAPPAAAPPLDIRWLRDGKPLTLQAGGAVWRSGGAAAAESRLRLAALRAADAGRYVCAARGRSAAVLLSVGDAAESADALEAMQRDQAAGGAGAGAGAGARGARLATLVALLAPLALA